MVPVLLLVGIAFAVIKALMSVVARDEAAGISLPAEASPVPAYDPTIQPRARVHDDARGFLLPASPDPDEREPSGTEAAGATDSSR